MNKDIAFPKKPIKTYGGVKVPNRKNTAQMESVTIKEPEIVILPMCQHIGEPCKVKVKIGDIVKVGQVIGDTEANIAAPIHASVSGEVIKIKEITLTRGKKCDAVVIKSDKKMTLMPNIKPPVINSDEDLVTAIRNSGLVGLGGAGFPAHVKLNIDKNKNIDTLIVNGAECEPYITSDHRQVIEQTDEVITGISIIKETLNIKRVIIGVEDNKPDVIKTLNEAIKEQGAKFKESVKVLKLKSIYPQGAERVLVHACTGKKISKDMLPADVGCIVMNITSVGFVGDYITTGIPLIYKRITVDGSAITEPKNIIVPIGTPIKDIINCCKGFTGEEKKVLMGGPMMGVAINDEELPVIKQNNGILAFDDLDAALMEPTECIRCSRCVDACPMNLVPVELNLAVKRKDIKALDKYSIKTCMECGCCSYVCPAGIHLVQNFTVGKEMFNEAKVNRKVRN